MALFEVFKDLFGIEVRKKRKFPKRAKKTRVKKKPRRKAKSKPKKKLKKKITKKVKKKTPKKKSKPNKKIQKRKMIKPLKKALKGISKKEIGIITHYFGKISVGIIKLKSDLIVGDKIHIKGAHDDFTQLISSMQLNHKEILRAKKGDEVGVKVSQRVHENDKVYKVSDA